MGERTGIEWTHHTFNPWWGCVELSPACEHCYARAWAKRTGRELWGPAADRWFFGEAHWREPLRWNAAAQRAGERRRVFCASMADVAEQLPSGHPAAGRMAVARAMLWDTIAQTEHLDWLLLSKRPGRFARILPAAWRREPRRNLWLGTTVEAAPYLVRVEKLLATPAAVHFLSVEPLLGPLDLRAAGALAWTREELSYDAADRTAHVGWIIVGGESGPGARPMHPAWVRKLRDQAAGVGVPFFFKQWGEWTPGENVTRHAGTVETATLLGGDAWEIGRESLARSDGHRDDEPDLYRVGKQAAGRLLDGREWSEVPCPA